MLIPVVNHLHQLVSHTTQPEQRRISVEMYQMMVKMWNCVIGDADIDTDTVGPAMLP